MRTIGVCESHIFGEISPASLVSLVVRLHKIYVKDWLWSKPARSSGARTRAQQLDGTA